MLGFVAILAFSLMRVGLCGYFSCQSCVLDFVAILAVSLMRVGLCGYFSCQSDALGGGGRGKAPLLKLRIKI